MFVPEGGQFLAGDLEKDPFLVLVEFLLPSPDAAAGDGFSEAGEFTSPCSSVISTADRIELLRIPLQSETGHERWEYLFGFIGEVFVSDSK